MNQSKVIHAFTKDNVIFGLSDEGHLVSYDLTISKWMFRGSNEIMTGENAVLLRSESFKAPEYVVALPVRASIFVRFRNWLKRRFNLDL